MRDTITLTNGKTVEVGTWLDGWHGWTNAYRIIEIAEAHGFTMDAEERAALEWYKASGDSDAGASDDELTMLEIVSGQGGLSDQATDHMENLLPDGWTLHWDAGELSLAPTVSVCAYEGNGCVVDVDYRDGREVFTPCGEHRPDYKIKVELQRTDGHWFSYGIALRDPDEDLVPLESTSVTFEAPGLDNLKVEGDHWHPSTIGSKDVREAAEELIAKHEKAARCEGHGGEDGQLTSGAGVGETVYCDGSCKD